MAIREITRRGSTRLVVGVALVVQLLVVQVGFIAPGATAAADRILTNGEHFPDGFVVPAGETWVFDPSATTSITASGNVEVRGRLELKPSHRTVNHTLTFTGIDESRIVGAQHGQVVPVASDVGLWVLGDGVLDVQGAEKTPWSYTYDSDWAGDEVRATPVVPGSYTSFPTVTSTPSANALGHRPELLNLSRNVTIQGTSTGRTHIFLRSSQPQRIRHATIRHVSPDITGGDPKTGTNVTGRYGLHFHHSMDGSRGSLVEGVVIRNAANHAFVPHHSHGITFRDTIAYDTTAEAYWWDESNAALCGSVPDCNVSHDILYDGVIAAMTHASPYSKHESASIQLGAGEGNAIINSVAVGMRGKGMNNSGFKWPSKDQGAWTFHNNVAHNNEANGAFIWHNGAMAHHINGFVVYHNKKAGIVHGAYNNAYVWQNLTLLGNQSAIESHALGRAASNGTTDTQRWENILTGGKGVLRPQPHSNINDATTPVRFTHCDFAKVELSEVGANGKTKSTAEPGAYDFIECDLAKGDFDLSAAANATVIRVQDGNTAYRLTGAGAMTTIAPFAPVDPPLPPAPPPRRVPGEGSTPTTTLPPTTISPTTSGPPTTTAPTTTAPTTTWAPTTTTAAPTTTLAPTSTTRVRDRDTTTTTRVRDRDTTTTTRRPRGGGVLASQTAAGFADWEGDVPPEVVLAPYFCSLL